MYKRNVATKGVEARLYGAMCAGPGLAIGCIIFGLTSVESVHWIAPCVGLVIILSTLNTLPFDGNEAENQCPLIRSIKLVSYTSRNVMVPTLHQP
jgi:hypothetical protein